MEKGKPPDRTPDNDLTVMHNFLCSINRCTGICFMTILAYHVATYLQSLHETLVWFSNISELEREISFRTEQGLYYSYFKQLLKPSNLFDGIQSLTVDNSTEFGRTINIVERFNIYQEIFLASVYRWLKISISPSVFYVSFIFALQSLQVVGLYSLAWILGHSWLSGVLTIALFVCNREHATRVNHAVPLRECFALPFFFCQLAVVSAYLKSGARRQVLLLTGISVFSFAYTLTWQFSQFVTLTQVIALFLLSLVDIVPTNKTNKILVTHFIVLLTSSCLQYGNTMTLSSLAFAFIPAAALLLNQPKFATKSIFYNLLIAVFKIIITILIALYINYITKCWLLVDSDQHILKFLKGKMGLQNVTDFESRLYLCNKAFGYLDWAAFVQLMQTFALPVYGIVLFVASVCVVLRVVQALDPEKGIIEPMDPSWAYNTVQSFMYALLAIPTLRMKCFWVPHVCCMASAGVLHPSLWQLLKFKPILVNVVRNVLGAIFVGVLIIQNYETIRTELNNLMEFWDPDTVELMNWIKNSTVPAASFAGSMQLMASVKLCTERPILNHPHFENRELRDRTWQIYQIYARQSEPSTHEILKNFNTSYIILEDSICYGKSDGSCALKDIIDLQNGHIPEGNNPMNVPGLVPSSVPRFCDNLQRVSTSSFFTLVFANKTFRVYRVT